MCMHVIMLLNLHAVQIHMQLFKKLMACTTELNFIHSHLLACISPKPFVHISTRLEKEAQAT